MFALAKLVATDTVAKEHLAPEIISHLEKYDASVGEIVKHLLTGLKKKGDVSNILVEALKRAYQRYLAATSSGNDEESSKKFQECKDLAARLSGSYVGVARNKYKSEILNVVREGINYAFSDAPKQLSFLEGAVLYFVSKLPASDILDIWWPSSRRVGDPKNLRGFQLAKHRAKLEQRPLSGDSLRACVKAIKFCSTGSQGELQDFVQNQIKDLERCGGWW